MIFKTLLMIFKTLIYDYLRLLFKIYLRLLIYYVVSSWDVVVDCCACDVLLGIPNIQHLSQPHQSPPPSHSILHNNNKLFKIRLLIIDSRFINYYYFKII